MNVKAVLVSHRLNLTRELTKVDAALCALSGQSQVSAVSAGGRKAIGQATKARHRRARKLGFTGKYALADLANYDKTGKR